MSRELEIVVRAILIGAGATFLLDLFGVLLKRCFQVPSANWGMVGRWVGHMLHGRFVHASIAQAAPFRGERALGWTTHYAIGVAFACALLSLSGLEWARHPTLPAALLVGVLTVVFPYFVLQPGMGAGIAASKTPNPKQARLRSLMNHAVFGMGMYVAAVVTALLLPR